MLAIMSSELHRPPANSPTRGYGRLKRVFEFNLPRDEDFVRHRAPFTVLCSKFDRNFEYGGEAGTLSFFELVCRTGTERRHARPAWIELTRSTERSRRTREEYTGIPSSLLLDSHEIMSLNVATLRASVRDVESAEFPEWSPNFSRNL